MNWFVCFILSSSPNSPNAIRSERDYHNHHYSISRKTPILTRQINAEDNSLANDHEQTDLSVSSSSKVKWIDAVRTVTQLNQVRTLKRKCWWETYVFHCQQKAFWWDSICVSIWRNIHFSPPFLLILDRCQCRRKKKPIISPEWISSKHSH